MPKQSQRTSSTSADDDALRRSTKVAVWKRRALTTWTLIGAAILIYVLGIVMHILAVPVGILIWTCIIVFVLRSPVNAMERRGISRFAGTAIAYVGMVIVMLLIILLMSSPIFGIGDQFQDLVANLPSLFQQISDYVHSLMDQYQSILQNSTVQGWITSATDSASEAVGNAARAGANNIVDMGSAIANTGMVIGFALVVAFWILMELPAIGRETKRLIPERNKEDARFLHVTFTRIMGGYIRGTLIQCFVIAVGCTIAFGILGIPNSIAFGIICGLLNIIPIVGPWLGGAAAAFAAIFVSPWIALFALVITIAIQQFVYTFVSPKIMADSVDVHPALVIIAMMIGAAVGGAMSGFVGSLVGMLLSIPAAAVGKALFVYYFEKKTGRHLVATDGVFFKGVPNQSDVPDPAKDAISPHPEMLARRIKADAARHARRAAGSLSRISTERATSDEAMPDEATNASSISSTDKHSASLNERTTDLENVTHNDDAADHR